MSPNGDLARTLCIKIMDMYSEMFTQQVGRRRQTERSRGIDPDETELASFFSQQSPNGSGIYNIGIEDEEGEVYTRIGSSSHRDGRVSFIRRDVAAPTRTWRAPDFNMSAKEL